MKKLFQSSTCSWVFACLFFGTNAEAQHSAPLLADDPILTTGLQLSSAAFVKGQLYSVEEKFHRLLIIDPISMRVVREDPGFSEKIDKEAEIEAIAVYKNNRLLMTDEAHASILEYDITSNKLSPVKVNGIDISSDKGEMGIEGIAIEGDSICYLLKERDDQYRSQIRVFNIKVRNGKTELDYTGTNLLVQHSEQPGTDVEHRWRYSDLYFDGGNLYAMRSLFAEKGKDPCKYIIDAINVGTYRGRQNYLIDDSDLVYWDISPKINHYRNTHSTNLEGLAFRNNKIYTVSDNVKGESDPEYSGYDKTMIIALQKP